ncbi:MAG: hypothetical protein ACLT1J_08190 [Mediterraneibacter gnavus]
MMQLFHEIYGNYYNTIAAILDQAIRSKVSVNEIEKIVEEKAFCESGLEIMDALRRENPVRIPKPGRWPLLKIEAGGRLSKMVTYRPLTHAGKTDG